MTAVIEPRASLDPCRCHACECTVLRQWRLQSLTDWIVVHALEAHDKESRTRVGLVCQSVGECVAHRSSLRRRRNSLSPNLKLDRCSAAALHSSESSLRNGYSSAQAMASKPGKDLRCSEILQRSQTISDFAAGSDNIIIFMAACV
eukprot:5858355-Amphidinium_carterae.1